MATVPMLPPLSDGMRIGDWKHLFLASVQQMLNDEQGQRKAIQLLPACINRRPAERELVRDVLRGVESIEGALKILEDTLDPPIDQYQMMQQLCRSDWEPGTQVDDFFFEIRRKGQHSNVGMKFVASILASQLPKDIQSKLRDKVRDVNDDIEGVDGRELIRLVKRELVERGYPLDLGNKDFEKIRRVAVVSEAVEPASACQTNDSTELLPPGDEMVAYAKTNRTPKWNRQPRQSMPTTRGCYICGGSHSWKYCPEKCCPGCGEKGHVLRDCLKRGGQKGGRRILNLNRPGVCTELSVVIPVRINGKSITAILDSGAGPSVIDHGTICEWGLEPLVHNRASQVYGLSRKPIGVVGSVNLTVDLGDGQVVSHTFQVLRDTATTRILGRDLLKKFQSTEFDWDTHRVRLGNVWKESQATIEGGEPLSRAEVACLEVCNIEDEGGAPTSTNINLDRYQRERLNALLTEYSSVFAENPKKPAITSLTRHMIITGNSQPVKQNIRRVSPDSEKEINNQVKEMLANGVCRTSNSPWCSRVILVSKRDGSTRFVVDYRGLNNVTTKDAYPMPNPKDILDKMHGKTLFSFLDAASAYWCVELEEEDKHKTAFATPRGHYEMNRMAFGLCNSQATYQRLMDNTLRGIRNAESYVDDICVYSDNFQDHLTDLRQTLAALRGANICIKNSGKNR